MIDLLGWGSSIILLSTLVRQVYTQWCSRTTAGLSGWLFVGQCAASVGYTVYSYLLHNWIYVSSNIAILITAIVGESLFLRNRRAAMRQPDEGSPLLQPRCEVEEFSHSRKAARRLNVVPGSPTELEGSDALFAEREPVDVSSTPIHDPQGGVCGAVLVARDMTAAREAVEKLSRLALYDHLTGLPNRALFADRLDSAISMAQRTGRSFCVLYIDLDKFKTINDTLGHEAGDQLLQLAAERLRHCVRRSDTVSRHGGDEFAALLVDCAEIDAAIPCAAKVVEALSEPYELGGINVHLSASVGIGVFPSDATEPRELMRAADSAMYRAKASGRNGFRSLNGSLRGTERATALRA